MPHTTPAETLLDLRAAHQIALDAAMGDSNDEEIEAWRELAEAALSAVPDYIGPED